MSSEPCPPGPDGQLPDGTPCYTEENILCRESIRDDARDVWEDAMAVAMEKYELYQQAELELNQAYEDQCPPQSSSSSSSSSGM